MRYSNKNYAFIDGQNLYLGIKDLGWKLDYKRFRVYLREKYGVSKAYMFMGFLPENQKLYNFLQTVGFVLVFKPIMKDQDGEVKGNVDAELVLHAMIEYKNYDKAIIITGDGDFYCLVNYLLEQKKLESIIVPNRFKFSALLKFRSFKPYLRYTNDLRGKLEYKKKSPHEDETS